MESHSTVTPTAHPKHTHRTPTEHSQRTNTHHTHVQQDSINLEQEFSFSAWDVFLMYSMMARIVWITATRNDPNAIEPVGWGGEEEGERGERMHARE